MGRRGEQGDAWWRSACGSQHAAPQRNRSLASHPEIGRLETVSAQVVTMLCARSQRCLRQVIESDAESGDGVYIERG